MRVFTCLTLGGILWGASATSLLESGPPLQLSWWISGPVSGGCSGWGMPYPGYNEAAKAHSSCWNNTLALVAEHAMLIDSIVLGAGFLITETSNGLLDFDRDGSSWSPGYRERPLEWIPHWVPELLAVLKPHTKIKVSFFFGSGHDNSTSVAQQAYANADELALQMAQLASDYDWIDGYILDYEEQCGDDIAICVPREAHSLTDFFKTLSTALHANGKTLGFCTNKHGSGFLHWQYYRQYLAAGVDRLYEMGTYLNHTRSGGPIDRENVTRQLLQLPLNNTAFGLGDYGMYDTIEEVSAWLTELQKESTKRREQLQVHVFDLFGARPPAQCPDRKASGRFAHNCVRPPPSWWPVLEQFHQGQWNDYQGFL